MSAFAALARLARANREREREPGCDLCGTPLESVHFHVVDREASRLLCACRACASSFAGTSARRHRAVPKQVRRDATFRLSDAELAALGVPVGLFFLCRRTNPARWVGFFPGALGPAEAEVDQAACAALAARSKLVATLEPDVEALLIRRERSGAESAYAVPIDECYRLTGLLRQFHRGFDGGDEARAVLEDFFAELARRSEPLGAGTSARAAHGEAS